MKTKKLLSLLLIAAMSITCLTACGDKGKDSEINPTPAPVVNEPTAAPTTAPADNSGLTKAKDYLENMYKSKDGSATATASDYTVVGVVKIDGVTYSIDWSVDAKDGVTVGTMDSKKMVTIDVNENTPDLINYNLTATIKDAAGKSEKISFAHFVPAYKEYSWADYAAAKDDQTVVCKGVVTAIIAKSKGNSSNALYFQDNDGGYYVYNLDKDPVTELGIKSGMTVKATGTRSTYSGTYEIINASVEIIDSNITAVTPADYTALFKNAATTKDAALTEKQGLLVTVKGVEILGQDPSNNTYYNFKLADKQSYIRISSSVCPITKDEQTKFNEIVNSNIGYSADATGILTLYDGAFYLSPITENAFDNFKLVERDDAGKVAFEKEKLVFPAKINSDTTLDLRATGVTYTDVAITYDVTGATAADGKLPIVLDSKPQTITVVATIKCNNATDTLTATIEVDAKSDDMPVSEVLNKAFALAKDEAMPGTQVLRGTITEITSPYSDKYNNITVNLQVGDKIITCFRLKGGEELKVGDVITVTGNIKNYKGTVEFDSGCTYSKTLSVEEAKQLLTIEKAYALGAGETMSGKQVLSGKITEITTAYSDKYNNITVTLQVGDKTISCFRLTGGADLQVGDVITVTGFITNYKGTSIQFSAGATYVKGQKLAYAKDLIVMEKAYNLGEDEELSGVQEITGTILSIDTPYSDKYDNITVTLEVGTFRISAFRLKGGQDLKVGDVITVTGTIKNYKGTSVQFNAGATYVLGAVDSTPATGDSTMTILFVLLLMAAASFAAMMYTKRRAH